MPGWRTAHWPTKATTRLTSVPYLRPFCCRFWLVHRMTTTVPEMPSGKRVVLLPTNAFRTRPTEFVNSNGNPKLPNDSLTIGHIYELRIKLRYLSDALFAYGKHVAGSGPAPLLTLLEQPVVQPKIVDLVNRTRLTLELPPLPSPPSRRRKS